MRQTSRHQCLIYQGAPSKHLDRLARSLIDNLRRNNRCLYLNSPAMVAGMRSWLSALGLEVTKELEKGALILSSERSHLEGGQFNIEKMLASLQTAVAQALADGYAGLWASGDMTWEMGENPDLAKLLEYEHALEQFMQTNLSLSGICQYHRDTLPPAAILVALRTHKDVRVNETLMRFNPHYQPPHTVQHRWQDDLAAEGINSMLSQLTE
jgi:MEDS: MEthanogen/methylotroph, DcmR Sensory domain